ncbi:uncharacterized protein PADG_11130 [Paracoccidioides brasiliensis Pb18]|uniref:Uncharacterized protein n=1 Tax=Paracoccidioides brasiliensis (strain Pb18) TaxID=502780 RepID=A0A0A0HU23_PARBD|nr:uncharacterized protein PADG_11130 [Paracoccidioides brasiliensis Pb18]KGM92674.1 hypothetical protein PADG_11130 [Paracoccidioides brasiliensis Pb18]
MRRIEGGNIASLNGSDAEYARIVSMLVHEQAVCLELVGSNGNHSVSRQIAAAKRRKSKLTEMCQLGALYAVTLQSLSTTTAFEGAEIMDGCSSEFGKARSVRGRKAKPGNGRSQNDGKIQDQ